MGSRAAPRRPPAGVRFRQWVSKAIQGVTGSLRPAASGARAGADRGLLPATAIGSWRAALPGERQTIVLLLLAVACAATAWGLVRLPPATPPPMALPVEELTSAIHRELIDLGLPPDSIDTRLHEFPELGFVRPEWRVRIPRGFSSTTLHYTVDERLRSLGYDSPARVEFPSGAMTIQLIHSETVRMTLLLTPPIRPRSNARADAAPPAGG